MAGKIQRYHEAKTKKPVKFIYFDIGGVLLDISGSFISLANVLNASVDDVRDFWAPRDDALNLGTMTAGEFWQKLKTHFHYKGRDIDFVDLWITSFRSIKETHAFVLKISRTHKIGLLTNAMAGTVAKTRALGHIPRVKFAAVIESSVLGITKPDPKIFTVARKRAGVEAGEILFIDDNEINVLRAHESGFHTYHFDTNNPASSVKELERFVNLSGHVPCVTK
jgi:epoxide hydrolase-like predicted phosphatase